MINSESDNSDGGKNVDNDEVGFVDPTSFEKANKRLALVLHL